MKKIAIFAHDAGGSELLLELLKDSLHVGEFRVFCIDGSPCYVLMIDKKLTKYQETIEPTKEFIFTALNKYAPHLILYSTGWQNHFEYHFLAYAKKYNLPSVAFLDNWTNFRERFSYPDTNWQKNFPDFIAAHDKSSKMVADSLDLKNVIIIKNYSLSKQIEKYKKIDIKEENVLLYLSEPTSKVAKKTYGDSRYWGFDESDIYKNILKYQKKLACNKIIVRLHPSDNSDIYKKINPNITISSVSLEKDIARAKVIIGLDTSVLYLAFLLGKKAISYLPSKKRNFHIPIPKNNQIRNLDNIDINSIKISSQNKNSFGMDFALFIKNILRLL